MIETIKPYGSIGENTIQYRYVEDNKFYVVDTTYNKMEVSESEYNKLKCPVRKRGN